MVGIKKTRRVRAKNMNTLKLGGGIIKRKIPQKLHKTLSALGHSAPWNSSSGGAIKIEGKNKKQNKNHKHHKYHKHPHRSPSKGKRTTRRSLRRNRLYKTK